MMLKFYLAIDKKPLKNGGIAFKFFKTENFHMRRSEEKVEINLELPESFFDKPRRYLSTLTLNNDKGHRHRTDGKIIELERELEQLKK